MMKCFGISVAAALSAVLLVLNARSAVAEILVDFEGLPVNASGYFEGDVNAGSPLRDNYEILGSAPGAFGGTDYFQEWTQDGVAFSNVYNSIGFWSGWSWSNVVDSTNPGFGNQYASFPGGGSDGNGGVQPNGVYAVAYAAGAYVNVPEGYRFQSIEVTNTTYAALSMRDGDQFAKKFGGDSGNDPDYFRGILTGYDGLNGSGNAVASVQFDLADFTFTDNSQDYILDSWLAVDLEGLGFSRSFTISFESTDVGANGMNTPAYFAVDNVRLTAIPEPGTWALLGCLAAGAGYRVWRRK